MSNLMAFNTGATPMRVRFGCKCSPNNTAPALPTLKCICSSRYWIIDPIFESLLSAKDWAGVSRLFREWILLAVILYIGYRLHRILVRTLYGLFCQLVRYICQDNVYEASAVIRRVPVDNELGNDAGFADDASLMDRAFPVDDTTLVDNIVHVDDTTPADKIVHVDEDALGDDIETGLEGTPQEQLDDHQIVSGPLNVEDQARYQRLHQRLRLLASEDLFQSTATELRDTQQNYLDAHQHALQNVRAGGLERSGRNALRTTRLALHNARQTHHKVLEARRDTNVNDWNFPSTPGPLRIRTYIGADVRMTRKGFGGVSKGHDDVVRRACAISANKHGITKVLVRSAIHNTTGGLPDHSHITCNFYNPDNEDLYRAVHVYVKYANTETGELCDVLDESTNYIPNDYAWERVVYERDSFLDPKYEQWLQAGGNEVWADGASWSKGQPNDWHSELDKLEGITKVGEDIVRRETSLTEEQREWLDEHADWEDTLLRDYQENGQDGWLGTLQDGKVEDDQHDFQLDDQTDRLTDIPEDD